MESILLDRETNQLYVFASSVISFTNMLEIKDRVSHAPCRIYTVQCCCVSILCIGNKVLSLTTDVLVPLTKLRSVLTQLEG